MSLPIIFIHQGRSDYLEYSLKQARRSNPNGRLILLSDRPYSAVPHLEHHELRCHWRDAEAFQAIYRHLSPNSYQFELFCLQRWFALNDFMRAMEISSAYYQDSDVMLFANVSEERRHWSTYQLSFVASSGHSIFIEAQPSLAEFCDFITRHFADPALLAELQSWYEDCKSRDLPGVSDMTMFDRFRSANPAACGNLHCVHDLTTFDDNCNLSADYVGFFGNKKLFIENGMPHCRSKALGNQLVRFNTLHFQGRAKKLMRYAYEERWRTLRIHVVLAYFGIRHLVSTGRNILRSARRRT